MEIQDRRVAATYSFPARLHFKLDEIARARFDENRSAAAEHYIMLGFEAERAKQDKPAPPPAA